MSDPAFREGDWYCEHCGDHQFSKNTLCRKCGSPKPVAGVVPSGNTMLPKPGDWICPNPACQDVQFERNISCRKCGTPKPLTTNSGGLSGAGGLAAPSSGASLGTGSTVPFAPDDWYCLACGDHQFAKNVVCRKCATPKPQAGGNNQVARPRDWICPNPRCQDLQFERNVVCRRCGTPKPRLPGQAPGPAGRTPQVYTLQAVPNVGQTLAATLAAGGSTTAGGSAAAAVPGELSGMTAGGGELSGLEAGGLEAGGAGTAGEAAGLAAVTPEDWICVNCGDHQFARNLACRKCSAPKPTLSSNNQASKMGDWICPNPACRDVQFEKNHICRRCGTARPMSARPFSVTTVQGGSSPVTTWVAPSQVLRPGDWTCPNANCRDVQFERNQKCRLCGTPKPMVSSNKQVFKAGDWICPNPQCGDVQFEKNSICRRCGTAKPMEGEDTGRTRSRSPAGGVMGVMASMAGMAGMAGMVVPEGGLCA